MTLNYPSSVCPERFRTPGSSGPVLSFEIISMQPASLGGRSFLVGRASLKAECLPLKRLFGFCRSKIITVERRYQIGQQDRLRRRFARLGQNSSFRAFLQRVDNALPDAAIV